MIDEDFNFSFDEDSLYDIVKYSDQYRWKPSFHFYGSRSKEQANGYGSSIPTQELYELLDDPFIERYFDTVYPYLDIKKQGDDLIYEMSKELFPYVENIGFSEKEAEEEKMQQEIIKKEIQVKELSKQKYDIQKLLCSLQILYEKRLQKLEKQGYHSRYHPTPEEEGLLKRAKQEVEEYKEVVISEKKKREW